VSLSMCLFVCLSVYLENHSAYVSMFVKEIKRETADACRSVLGWKRE